VARDLVGDPGDRPAAAAAPEGLADSFWFERDTTPSKIEAAVRELQIEHVAHGEHGAVFPARVLNLVAVVDRPWRGEIENRLERVGRYHASRTVLCAVEPRRTTIDARIIVVTDEERAAGEITTTHEHLVLDIGETHVAHLDSIIDPLVVTDLPTMLWSPHGNWDAVDALLGLAQVVLLDSVDEPDLEDAVHRAWALSSRVYVVDLAWLRSTPWRERIAASFDPLRARAQLPTISSVEIRHHPESAVAGVLLFGWLASRLGWTPGALAPRHDALEGRARNRKGEVRLALRPDPSLSVRGLAGITIETGQGTVLELDRGAGGLHARRVTRGTRGTGDTERTWTVMGASRGEAGILGEGIRQALLRDPTYRPALTTAESLLHA
jgi:glucose-6-phosphate dehydrogenase assembly protein OpcA